MTSKIFVAAIKDSVRRIANNEAELFSANKSLADGRFEHLDRFGNLFQRLSPVDQETLRDLIQFTAEGCLFNLLTLLDNSGVLTDERGELELYHVSEDGKKVRLNDPDEDFLQDLFNNM